MELGNFGTGTNNRNIVFKFNWCFISTSRGACILSVQESLHKIYFIHLLFEIISIESTFPIHSPPPPPINNNTSDNSSLRYQIKFSPILNVNFLLKKRKGKKIDTDNEGGSKKKRNPCLSIFIQFFSEKKHERQRKREKKREIYASYYFQKSCLPAIIRSMGR